MSLFKKTVKSPAEIVKSVSTSLLVIEKHVIEKHRNDKKAEKACDDIVKQLQAMKYVLYGTENHEPNAESVAQLAQETYSSGIMHSIIKYLHLIDFEGKKDFTQIFNNLLRRQIGPRMPTVEHLMRKPETVTSLVLGYEQPDIALHCGLMLRECIRYEPLAKLLLDSKQLYRFFGYVEFSTFDIASDAFSTFKDLLTRHKAAVEECLSKNYVPFFEKYTKLLSSENYVTRRQSLKLLGELLLDRHNFAIMTKYIGNAENLKLIMNCLRDSSKNIQFEAFHVFKVGSVVFVNVAKLNIDSYQVFVANPKKTQPILDILLKNQQKLLDFLSKFHNDRTDDEQFNDEKSYLIKQIRELKPSEG